MKSALFIGRGRSVRRGAAIAGAMLLSLGSLALSGGVSSAASGNTGSIVYTVHPVAVQATNSSSTAGLTPGQCIAQAGLACYDPQILHTAYQVPWTIDGALAGTGEQIAIIDAYGSPTLTSDLATYDQAFGLPPADLHVYYPGGKPTYNPLQNSGETGWAEETSLDVQTAHAFAPGARINLIVAASPSGNVLNNAENFVVANHLGDVMSMSYGAPEAAIAGGGNNLQLQQAHAVFQQAVAAGISIFASSGDDGATNGYPTANALYPASDPLVTSTGGTNLFVKADNSPRSTNGTYTGEYTWNDSDPSTCPFGCDYGTFGATGGAASSVFGTPNYQTPFTSSSMRTTSDVAFNSSVYTATLIYLGFLGGSNNGFYFFGGTSEAAPSWAAITADLDQAHGSDLGQLDPVLYSIASNAKSYAADFHDVTVGNNQEPYPSGAPGSPASTGYDVPTGLGTPVVTGLLKTLAPRTSYSMTQP